MEVDEFLVFFKSESSIVVAGSLSISSSNVDASIDSSESLIESFMVTVSADFDEACKATDSATGEFFQHQQ